jgi:hypothetical protein
MYGQSRERFFHYRHGVSQPTQCTPARAAVARFDDQVDSWFDRLRGNPVADRLFYGASELGDFSLVWLILGALRGLRSRDRGKRGDRRNDE